MAALPPHGRGGFEKRLEQIERAALRDAFERRETFTASMRRKLRPMGKGESVAGVLAWRDSIPGSTETLVLIEDGKGTLHQRLVDDVWTFQRGNRVTLALR